MGRLVHFPLRCSTNLRHLDRNQTALSFGVAERSLYFVRLGNDLHL